MTKEDIEIYYKDVVYKHHPEYIIEVIALEDPLRFYLIVRLENDNCYCFILLTKDESDDMSQMKPSKLQLEEINNNTMFPDCVLKRVTVLTKKEDKSVTHTTYSLQKYEAIE